MKSKIIKAFSNNLINKLVATDRMPVVYAEEGGAGSYTYDISEGAIHITTGTNGNTLKVAYGGGSTDNIPLSQAITIIGSAIAETDDNIIIEGVKVTLVLDNVYLKTNVDRAYKSPIALLSGADLTLKLKGTSTLHSSSFGAGINVSGGTTLTITSNNGDGSMDGTLNAIAEGSDLNAAVGLFYDGAGIGAIGGNSTTIQTLGNINIKGGTVIATGGGGGAGIGGSSRGTTGTINISGGKIIAKAGEYGINGSTAIGGGVRGYVSQINITGGDIQAIGGHMVPGIGGGYSINNSGEINISGGKIDAKGKDSPVSIGYNVNPDESDRNGSIKITGGDINLNGGTFYPEAKEGTQTLKEYQLNINIYDGRLIESIENVAVEINGKVYNGKINSAERCVGTISVLTLIPENVTGEKILSITAGSYNWATKVNISGTSGAIPVTIGEKLYPVYLWFYDASITEDIADISYELKRNGIIPSASNDSIKSYQSDGKIIKTADGIGKMTIYMVSGDKTDISVTINSLNGGAVMSVIDQNIKKDTVGTNIIVLDSTDTAQLAEAIDLFRGNITFEHEESTGKLKITYFTATGQKTLSKQRYQNEFRIIQSDNGTATGNYIIVKNTIESVNINLEGVNIKPTEAGVSPIRLEGAKANLYLVGDNKVDASGPGYAAVNVDGGSEVVFDGTGKIEVMAPTNASAGIGGNNSSSTGKITINGGTIISRGYNGAAIGTGTRATSSNYGSIYINGGMVKAYSSSSGAAIGGGRGASPSNVYISGGTVYAEASPDFQEKTATIGGGYKSNSGGEIIISGGYVEAKSTKGPAIGSGGGEDGYTQAICPAIKISGGTLKLTGIGAEIGIPDIQKNNTHYPDGKGLTIIGGTIFKESGEQASIGGSLPSNGTGSNVYYTKADVRDVYGSDSDIEDASITDISYGFKDVKTDSDGILHIYLPANTDSEATYARFADDYYKGIITSTEATNELTKLISLTGATVSLTLPVEECIYDGTKKNPGIIVSLGGNTVNSDNYDVSYFNTNGGVGNHTNAGTVNVTVTGENNYVASASKSFEIAKADQSNLSITAVDGKRYGDAPFTLATTGGSGSGQVSYSLPTDNGVLSVSGSTATIIGVGTVTLTASKAGEGGNYNSITATREIAISKIPAPTISFPTASRITYGQKLSESILEGGNTELGSFAWIDGSVVPNVGDHEYEVKFMPNLDTVSNYEDVVDKTANLSITVGKANGPVAPAVVASANDADNEILVVGGEEKITISIGKNMIRAYEYWVNHSIGWVDLPEEITGLTPGIKEIKIREKETITAKAGEVAIQSVTIKDRQAGSLTLVEVVAGEVVGTTKLSIDGTVTSGNRLVYKVGSVEVTGITVVDTVTDGQEFVSATTEIEVTADQYVTIYEIDDSNKVVRYISRKIVENEIKPPSRDVSVSEIKVKETPATVDGSDANIYNIELAAGTDLSALKALDIVVTATDTKARVSTATTSDSGKTWTVEVTAEDGTTKVTYTINVTVGANADQAAPTGLKGLAPTSSANNDGKITGTSVDMEYKLSSASDWTQAINGETIGLAAGNYGVRLAAKSGFNAGAVAEVVVAEYVAPVTLSSIAVKTSATKLAYKVGEELDITGLVIEGTYSDNSKKEETITVANITGFDSSKLVSSQTLTVTVDGKTVTYTIEIKEEVVDPDPVTLSSIAITTSATKLVYKVGEALDITGLVIEGTYSDASKKDQTITAANISGFDSSKAVSSQTLTVIVDGKTATYTIEIKEEVVDPDPVTLSSIAITTSATKLVYKVGEALDITGLVIEGTYSDASKKDQTITAANISGFDSSKAVASQTLTAIVDGKTATYTIEIKEEVVDPDPVTLSSIAITTSATKLVYKVGEELDITGLVIEGIYSDASTKVETITAANISGFDSIEAVASQTLTVIVDGKTATYTIEIKAADPESVSKTLLIEAITAVKYVSVSEDGSDIEKSDQWTTVETKTRLEEAVDAAQIVVAKADATQEEVNEAVTTLSNAVKAYNSSKAFGTKEYPTIKYTVAFKDHDGAVIKTQEVEEGKSATAPSNPSRSGYTFTGWDRSFSDITADITVIANYSKNSSGDNTGGGSSDSGGSSGGSSDDASKDKEPIKDKDTTRVESTKETNAPTKAIVSTSSKVTKGIADIEVSKIAVKDAIEKAEAVAKKNGTEKDGISVEIKVDTKNIKVSNLSANIPKSTLEDLIKAGVKNLSINSDLAVISLDLETLKIIRDKIDGDANLSVKKVDNNTLSPEVQKMVGSRPVFDFSITGKNGERVSKFGKGKISISIPYTLGADEKAENLEVYYINEDGKVEEMPSSFYDEKNGTISFETDHFSKFAIGYKEDADIITFTDIENHWAKDSIEFVTARGLFTGTGQDKFSPDMPMTRGMFVTVLGRLASADVSSYKASSFTDVKTDAYYMEHIEWANENNIVEGINQDNFGPDMPIIREQIAVILYRYSNYKNYDTTQGGMAIREFTDYESISDYALRSMAWTVNTGLLQGSDNKLMPKHNATRAQVAAILMRFSQTIK